MCAKRLFTLLPAGAVIFACWVTVACLVTVIVRQNRRDFLVMLFVTWWDLGRAIFSFWGGIFKFAFFVVAWLLSFLKLALLGIWYAIQDIVLSPLRVVKDVGGNAFKPGIPWIAVWLTLLWCAMEAWVFTFVTTNTVIDAVASLAGTELNIQAVQIILYLMLLGFVIGSYAILSNLENAVKARSPKQIFVIVIVEICALAFEVTFLYREFVEIIAQWLASASGSNFQLGIFGTLAVAALIWVGLRGLTWFLFAGAGTPTILAIIQRTGVKGTSGSGANGGKGNQFPMVRTAVERVMHDLDWCHKKGDEFLSAFVLPPVQIIGGAVNFCTLLISSSHLFDLPFKSYKELLATRDLVKKAKSQLRD